jgi:carbon-monoxide dehydrogenase small subunit
MSDRITVRMTVNGKARRVSAPPMKRLLDVLREDLRLTGTKEGCGEGECGACTVLLDGRTVNSCLVPAVHADGAKLVTVEGLAKGRSLTALQTAFVEMGGAQCGICTPGMLVSAAALIQSAKGRVPSDPEVREALAGNLCRCTGYQRIVDAVRAAAGAAAAKRTAKKRTTSRKAAQQRATRAATARQKAAKGRVRRPATRTTKKAAAKRLAPRGSRR